MSTKLSDFDRADVLAILARASSLTAGFDEGQIAQMADIVEVEEFDANELLLKEDDRSRDLYLIRDGGVSVEVKLTATDKAAIQISRMRNDSVIGEFSFIDGSRRSANVRAVMKTVVLRMPFDRLDSLCRTHTDLGYALMRNLAALMSQRLRDTNFELRAHLYL